MKPSSRDRARRLRRALTDAERLVWGRLRAHRLADLHFRRQVPMAGFIVDFACHEARLIIELDGGQHAEDTHRARDERRDSALAAEGYHVLRFFNDAVFKGLDDVIETIYRAALERLPGHPHHAQIAAMARIENARPRNGGDVGAADRGGLEPRMHVEAPR